MRKFTVDQKLKLVEQVRSRYNRNLYDLAGRERILYGKTSERNYQMPPEELSDDAPVFNTFQLRLLAALLLAVGVILLDRSGGSIAGISPGQIFDAISVSYEEDLNAYFSGLQALP